MASTYDAFKLGDEFFGDLGEFDDIEGFGEDSAKVGNSFFKNIGQSAKNFAVDLGNQYFAEVLDMAADAKYAYQDLAEKAADAKEKAGRAASAKLKEFKAAGSDTDVKKLAKEYLDGAKARFKSGDWYRGQSGAEMDFSSMMGDDEDSYEDDTSRNVIKRRKKVSQAKYAAKMLSGGGDTTRAIMSSTIGQIEANAKIQYAMYKKQAILSEQHFLVEQKVLRNIADNVFTITKFISHSIILKFFVEFIKFTAACGARIHSYTI